HRRRRSTRGGLRNRLRSACRHYYGCVAIISFRLLRRFRGAARVIDDVRVLSRGPARHHGHCQNACRQLHSHPYLPIPALPVVLATAGTESWLKNVVAVQVATMLSLGAY